MRKFLTDAEKQKITEAIRQAEAKTSGEFVAVIARISDDYRHIPVLWAGLGALAVPAVVLLTGWWWSEMDIYLAQIASFFGLAALFEFTALKMLLIPRAVKRRYASRRAREQFYAQGLHRTRGQTGVLLFVSVAEHYVEILADEGINAQVAPGTWDTIVGDFVRQVRQRHIGQGFLDAVHACGGLLAQHFPIASDDADELPNRLIEI